MKNFLFAAALLAATLTTGFAADVQLSGPMKEVLKLSQANVSGDTIRFYIESTPFPYTVSADQILYLRENGVKDDVINTLLKHGTDLRLQASSLAAAPPGAAAVPQPTTPPPNVPNAPPAQYPADQYPPVVQGNAPAPDYSYYYDYPYESYPDYYWAPGYWGWSGLGYVWIGPGWRWRGGGGFRGGVGGFRGGIGGFRGGVGGFHGGGAFHGGGGFHGGGFHGGFHGGGGHGGHR